MSLADGKKWYESNTVRGILLAVLGAALGPGVLALLPAEASNGLVIAGLGLLGYGARDIAGKIARNGGGAALGLALALLLAGCASLSETLGETGFEAGVAFEQGESGVVVGGEIAGNGVSVAANVDPLRLGCWVAGMIPLDSPVDAWCARRASRRALAERMRAGP